ncbi:MAG: hypothetical protein IID48_19440 [Proteobacteria bacterium]|nr:hypothetical protein [Pseudomonadota bacterium]
MNSRKLNSQLQRLTSLIGRTAAASAGELELQGHWGRYLCILVAGFLENAIGEIYAEFAHNVGSEPVANFVATRVLRIQNPKAQRFIETAGTFKAEWAIDLDVFLNQEGRKDAIDSIMNNRHLIAHGQNAGISVVRVKEYLDKCVEVVEFIEDQCGLVTTYE